MLHTTTTHSVFDDDYVSKISILPIITPKVLLKVLPTCIFPSCEAYWMEIFLILFKN